MEATAQINNYVKSFKAQLEIIQALKCDSAKDVTLQRKVLYVAVIDALSKAVFPRRTNKVRFVSFIQQFSDWAHCDRISLPHLLGLLERAPDPEFERLRSFAHAEIQKWVPDTIIHASDEPTMAEVQKLWPRAKEHQTPIEGVDLEKLRHDNLFYLYRNSLIHEYRQAGLGLEFSDDTEPFYMIFGEIEDDGRTRNGTWELAYPVKFFESVASNCLKNLEAYLRRNNLNPLHSYRLGSSWVEGIGVFEL